MLQVARKHLWLILGAFITGLLSAPIIAFIVSMQYVERSAQYLFPKLPPESAFLEQNNGAGSQIAWSSSHYHSTNNPEEVYQFFKTSRGHYTDVWHDNSRREYGVNYCATDTLSRYTTYFLSGPQEVLHEQQAETLPCASIFIKPDPEAPEETLFSIRISWASP